MSPLLRQARDCESYARTASRFAEEYEAEGDQLRAARYRNDAQWYSERATMYRQIYAERMQSEAA